MKVQVCRQCGKQNVVVSGPLTKCIFCDSSDLGDIENYSSEEPRSESNIGLKAGISVAVVLSLSVGGYLVWQSLNQNSAKSELTTASKSSPNISVAANEPHHSAQQAMASDKVSILNHSTNMPPNTSVNEDSPATSTDNKDGLEELKGLKDLKERTMAQEETASMRVENKSIMLDSGTETLGNQPSIANSQEAEIALDQPTKDSESLVASNNNQKPLLSEAEVNNLTSTKSIESTVDKEMTKKVDQVKPKTQKTVAKRTPEKANKPAKVIVKSEQAVKNVAQNPIDVVPVQLEPKQVTNNVVTQVNKESTLQVNQRRNKMRILDFNIGLVTDSKTGLMWMSCSLGMDGIGNGCYGEGKKLSWSEALKVAGQTHFGGFSDWRLPTRSELNSIVNCSNGRAGFKVGNQENYLEENGVTLDGGCLAGHLEPSIDRQAFSNTKSGVYWSSSQSRVYSFSAWVILFNKGSLTRMNKNFTGYVRLVRSI